MLTGTDKEKAEEFLIQYQSLSKRDKEKFDSFVTNPDKISSLINAMTTTNSVEEISLYNGDIIIRSVIQPDNAIVSPLAATPIGKRATNYRTGYLLGIAMMEILFYVDYHTDYFNLISIDGGDALTTFCYVPCAIEYTNKKTYWSTIGSTQIKVACFSSDVTWYYTFEDLGLVMAAANGGVWADKDTNSGGWIEQY